jgi:cytohesin
MSTIKNLLLTTIAAVLVVGCGNPENLLIEAAIEGNIEAVKQHLDAGADVNAKDAYEWTPLLHAAYSGHKEIVELLITNGADVNAKDRDDGSPLHSAAINGHKEIVELLIAKGADVNAKDDKFGMTPLHPAAYEGHKEVAEMLIAKGADVNAKDFQSGTPLDEAIEAKATETADLLRKHGGKTGEELKVEGK